MSVRFGTSQLGVPPEVDDTGGLVAELLKRLDDEGEDDAARYVESLTLTLPEDPREALTVVADGLAGEGWHALGRRVRYWRVALDRRAAASGGRR